MLSGDGSFGLNACVSENNLGHAIVEGALNPEVKDLGIELAEFELDAFLDEGVLKELPVVKSILAFRKTWNEIGDQLFLRKVASFVLATPKFTQEEINIFVADHWRGEEAKRLGGTLVLILNRLDDLEKPVMLAKVFAAFVRGYINRDAFTRLAAAIDQSSIQDLKTLGGEKVIPEEMVEPYPSGLVRSGLARLQLAELTYRGQAEFKAEISNLGQLFQNCILNNFQ